MQMSGQEHKLERSSSNPNPIFDSLFYFILFKKRLKIPLKKSHICLDYQSKVGRNIFHLHRKTCDIFSTSSKVVSSRITLTTNMWETKRDLEQKSFFFFFWETSKRFFELSGNFKRYLSRFDLHITILATIIISFASEFTFVFSW